MFVTIKHINELAGIMIPDNKCDTLIDLQKYIYKKFEVTFAKVIIYPSGYIEIIPDVQSILIDLPIAIEIKFEPSVVH